MIRPPPYSPLFPYTTLFRSSVIIAATWTKISQSYDLKFPQAPGPSFDNRVRKLYINKLESEKPEMVMLGDSTLLRSEEHTSELQSQSNLVCRLLLEKKQ